MPNKILVLNILSVVLQYSLLILIYYFIFKVIKAVHNELKGSENIHHTKTLLRSDHANLPSGFLRVVDDGGIPLGAASFDLGETTSIGRNQANDIIINDNFVSHEHACISEYKGQYLLSDLNSTNHTYLNGHPIDGEVALTPGDIITIGAVTFKYER